MTGTISWDWLRVFAACARHGNFTRAARDLATPHGQDRDPSVRAVMDWLLTEADRPRGITEGQA